MNICDRPQRVYLWTSLSLIICISSLKISQLCQQPPAALKQSGRPHRHLPIMPLPQSSMMPQALQLAAQARPLKVRTHRGHMDRAAQQQRVRHYDQLLKLLSAMVQDNFLSAVSLGTSNNRK